MKSCLGLFLLVPFLCTRQISARQNHTPTFPDDGKIHLEVVVTPKSGPSVSGLQQQDFTVFDNKVPQTIFSFQALREREAPIEVVLVIDDVNTGVEHIAFERSEIDKFLRTDGGQLAHPIALAFLTDAGIKVQDDFSSDGNAISAALDQYTLGLHSILRSGGVYSAVERFQVSLNALFQLGTREAARPGRKIILWISPGWPLLSGPSVEEQLNTKQQQQIFNQVVALSTLLRQGRITLYSIDPLGSSDFLGAFHWEAFVKGISKPSQTEWGDLALQVVATQSGGLALTGSNDITASVKQCLADTHAYYEISFDPATTDRPNEYHHLEIRIAKPGLTARTRQGYYSQSLLAGTAKDGSEKLGGTEDATLSKKASTENAPPADASDEVYYANAHPYLDWPVAQLTEHIPGLQAIQPARDQQELSMILQKKGRENNRSNSSYVECVAP